MGDLRGREFRLMLVKWEWYQSGVAGIRASGNRVGMRDVSQLEEILCLRSILCIYSERGAM